jgi:hypothetical protein
VSAHEASEASVASYLNPITRQYFECEQQQHRQCSGALNPPSLPASELHYHCKGHPSIHSHATDCFHGCAALESRDQIDTSTMHPHIAVLIPNTAMCQQSHQQITLGLLQCSVANSTYTPLQLNPHPTAVVLQTPEPPAQRPQLEKAIALIDEANSEDPTRITVDGQSMPYRCAALTCAVQHYKCTAAACFKERPC